MAKRRQLLHRTLLLRLGSHQLRPITAPRHLASALPRQPSVRRLPATALPALRSVAVDTCLPLRPPPPSTHQLPLAGLPRAPSLIRLRLLISLARRRRRHHLATARLLRLIAQREFCSVSASLNALTNRRLGLRVSEVRSDMASMARVVPLYYHQLSR